LPQWFVAIKWKGLPFRQPVISKKPANHQARRRVQTNDEPKARRRQIERAALQAAYDLKETDETSGSSPCSSKRRALGSSPSN